MDLFLKPKYESYASYSCYCLRKKWPYAVSMVKCAKVTGKDFLVFSYFGTSHELRYRSVPVMSKLRKNRGGNNQTVFTWA